MEGRAVVKKNDIFEIEITGMTDDGNGVGRAEGIAVFIPYTIIGEKVKTLIIKVNKTYAIGKLLDIIVPSQHRIKSECKYFYQCGGCQLWHMDYEAELEYKYTKVKDCIQRIGNIDIEISPIIFAEKTSRYRNKVQLPISEKGIGFYKKNSHIVTDIDDCLLQPVFASEIVSVVRQWMDKFNIEPYNEETQTGIIRHLYIRYGVAGIMVVLVATTENVEYITELKNSLKMLDLNITGIALNINKKNTNVVLSNKNIVIWGSPVIFDNIGDVYFDISPNSFYQVNKEQTLKLYQTVKRMANIKNDEILWDIYCGIGTIGQFIAKDAKKIIGIEIVPQAVEDAIKNARKNNILNAEYYCGAAELIGPQLITKGERPDVVVLDPPRKGCEEKLLDAVAKLKPKRIVYVSCKPSTLARDLKYLNSKGYSPKEIVPVDMFPRTSHVECCVLLSRE